jgi:imidazolonepropionase-like amidohydrolase
MEVLGLDVSLVQWKDACHDPASVAGDDRLEPICGSAESPCHRRRHRPRRQRESPARHAPRRFGFSKIVAIDRKASPIDYDLRGLTVMPGWIDAHVHITSGFGPDGKNAGMGAATLEAAYRTAANAYATLLAGFTTIQSMDNVAALREAAVHGGLPASRILSIAEPLVGRGEQTGTPDEVRAFVRKQEDAGADFLKIYASGGMRQTAQTIPQAALDAVCDEARKLGLRTLVHANYDAVHGAIAAGCTQVEHGLGAKDVDLQAMAEKGLMVIR